MQSLALVLSESQRLTPKRGTSSGGWCSSWDSYLVLYRLWHAIVPSVDINFKYSFEDSIQSWVDHFPNIVFTIYRKCWIDELLRWECQVLLTQLLFSRRFLSIHDDVWDSLFVSRNVPRIICHHPLCHNRSFWQILLVLIHAELDFFSKYEILELNLSTCYLGPLVTKISSYLAQIFGYEQKPQALVLDFLNSGHVVSSNCLNSFGLKDWFFSKFFIFVATISLFGEGHARKIYFLKL